MGTDEDISESTISEVEKHLIKAKLDEKDELREASGVASDKAKGQGSAIHKLITVSDEARQILYMANFKTDEDAEDALAALVEGRRYGLDEAMVLDWVIIHCGVSNTQKSIREWGVQALTHLELNQPSQHRLSWKNTKKEQKS